MNVKKITQILLFFIITTATKAQQLYLETGRTSSSFDYNNSDSVELDNLHAGTHSFMTMGYRTDFFVEKLKTFLGIGYFGYGAIGSDDTLEGILQWDANYLELNAGLDYGLFTINKIEFYVKGIVSTGFLIEGTQSLNNEIIDLKNVDDFDKAMVSFKAGAGFLYPVSNDLSFYAQYLFGKSLNQAGNRDEELLKIKSHNIGFGVLISLFKNN